MARGDRAALGGDTVGSVMRMRGELVVGMVGDGGYQPWRGMSVDGNPCDDVCIHFSNSSRVDHKNVADVIY